MQFTRKFLLLHRPPSKSHFSTRRRKSKYLLGAEIKHFYPGSQEEAVAWRGKQARHLGGEPSTTSRMISRAGASSWGRTNRRNIPGGVPSMRTPMRFSARQ